MMVALNMRSFHILSAYCFSTECKEYVDKKEVRMDFSGATSIAYVISWHNIHQETQLIIATLQLALVQAILKLYELQP